MWRVCAAWWRAPDTPARTASNCTAHADDATRLWDALLHAGAPDGLCPAGLGARDTLRLEKAYPLYGHELDDTTTPLEAGLEWVTKFSKPHFIGRDILIRQKETGVKRKLVGLEMIEPGIARSGYGLFKGAQSIGRVTSGTKSPSLGKSIALGYVASAESELGNRRRCGNSRPAGAGKNRFDTVLSAVDRTAIKREGG